MDYYVDANFGNDDWPGTILQPWRTITKAGETLIAGDTAHVMTGSYTGDVRVVNSGQVGQLVTFQAYPGHRPVIDSGLKGFRLSYVDYVVIDGFEITGLTRTAEDEGTAISGFNSRFCVVQNCLLHDNPRHGVLAYGPEGWTIEDCIVRDNGGHGFMLHESQAGLRPDGVIIRYCDISRNGPQIATADGSGIFIGGAGDRCRIEHNICESNAGNGILFGGTCNENVIANNLCKRNQWYGVWMSALTTSTLVENNVIRENICQRNNGGICVTASRSNDIYKNVIMHNDLQVGNVGGGLILWRGTGNRAWNNVVWGNRFATSAAGLQLGAWWEGDGEPVLDTVLLNNIVGANENNRDLQGSVELGSTLTREDHNNWYGDVSGFSRGIHSINADPRLRNDFRLAAGSPCTGAGIVEVPYPGALPDMGAFGIDDTTTPIRRLAAFKPHKSDTAFILEGADGREVTVLYTDYGLLTAARLRARTWEQFRDPNVHFHVNRDNTIAAAIGEEPDVWPEDEPDYG